MSNTEKAKNLAQIARGKLKKAVGRRLKNPQLGLEGRLDQAKGNLKQAGEMVKDAFKK